MARPFYLARAIAEDLAGYLLRNFLKRSPRPKGPGSPPYLVPLPRQAVVEIRKVMEMTGV